MWKRMMYAILQEGGSVAARKKAPEVQETKHKLTITGLDLKLTGYEEMLKVAVGRGIDTSGGPAVEQALTNLKEWRREQAEKAVDEAVDALFNEELRICRMAGNEYSGYISGMEACVKFLRTHLKETYDEG